MNVNLADYFDEFTRPSVPLYRRARSNTSDERGNAPLRQYRYCSLACHNAPVTFLEVVDLRYCLYHRCSRAGFVADRLKTSFNPMRHESSSAAAMIEAKFEGRPPPGK